MNDGITCGPASLARMWTLGLAYIRRTDDGWEITPADDLAGRYLAAFDIVAGAMDDGLVAEGEVLSSNPLRRVFNGLQTTLITVGVA